MPTPIHDTPKRCRFFNAFDDNLADDIIRQICKRSNIDIDEATGRRWLKKRDQYGEIAERRTRKLGARLGRPPACDYSVVKEITDPQHDLHLESLATVSRELDLGVSERTIRRQLKQQDPSISRLLSQKSSFISNKNQADRIAYGVENKGKAITGFWQRVYFTDKVHFNSLDLFDTRSMEWRQKG